MSDQDTNETLSFPLTTPDEARKAFRVICERVLGVDRSEINKRIKQSVYGDANDLVRLADFYALDITITINFNASEKEAEHNLNALKKKRPRKLRPLELVHVEDLDPLAIPTT